MKSVSAPTAMKFEKRKIILGRSVYHSQEELQAMLQKSQEDFDAGDRGKNIDEVFEGLYSTINHK